MTEKTNKNFISIDLNTAINSYGEVFFVGETVGHEDRKAGTAKILSFQPDNASNEVTAVTDKGTAHINFLAKLKP